MLKFGDAAYAQLHINRLESEARNGSILEYADKAMGAEQTQLVCATISLFEVY